MTTTSQLGRARAYVAKIPGAISGAGGHGQTFAVACALVRFGLPWDEAWEVLIEYNAICSPPWSERELEHKLHDAYEGARSEIRFERSQHFRPAPMPRPKIDPATAIENYLGGFRADEVDLWEASPIRPPDDWTKDALYLLEWLYAPGEQINFVTDFKLAKNMDGTVKANPEGIGDTVERDALVNLWRKNGIPKSESGGWLRMNPLDGQGARDSNVTAHRFALLECDSIPQDLQLTLYAKLPLPIALIITSGGRSLHAWVKLDATSAKDYRTTVARMVSLLAKFGVDGKNKNPSRLSRLPGVIRTIGARDDGRQRILYLSPNPTQKAIL